MQDTQGVIWVVDSNDPVRVAESRTELEAVLQDERMREAAVLVLANKQDLPGALTLAQLTDKLGLAEWRSRQWHIPRFVLFLVPVSAVLPGFQFGHNAVCCHAPRHSFVHQIPRWVAALLFAR